MAWYCDHGSGCDFRAGNHRVAIVKINNPSVGNVISTANPQAISIGNAAVAGALGEVSDSGHQHGVAVAQFMRLLGEQLTEGTTSSTTAVTIVTVSGLTIPVNVPILVVGSWRRSAGAAASAPFGFGVNGTVVQEAVARTDTLARAATTDVAASGAFAFLLNSRNASYRRAGARFSGADSLSGGDDALNLQTADIPNAEITSIEIRAFTLSALITLGVDDVRVYALPTT